MPVQLTDIRVNDRSSAAVRHLRRLAQRQDHRRARRHLQAQYRRHAARRRRCPPSWTVTVRVVDPRASWKPTLLPGVAGVRGCLHRRGRRRCHPDPDRMERVPRGGRAGSMRVAAMAGHIHPARARLPRGSRPIPRSAADLCGATARGGLFRPPIKNTRRNCARAPPRWPDLPGARGE